MGPHVVDEDEGADGAPVPVHAQRQPAPAAQGEARDRLLGELPGPVDVAAAGDEHRHAAGADAAVGAGQLLRRRLAGAVRVGWPQLVGLGSPARRRLAIDLALQVSWEGRPRAAKRSERTSSVEKYKNVPTRGVWRQPSRSTLVPIML